MLLINEQSNAILNSCPIDIPLVQRWLQCDVRFGGPKFDIICAKHMRINLSFINRFFFRQHCCYVQIIRSRLVFFFVFADW